MSVPLKDFPAIMEKKGQNFMLTEFVLRAKRYFVWKDYYPQYRKCFIQRNINN